MDRILLVDDQNAILRVTSRFLRDLGYEVEVAHDGEEAIDLFTDNYNFNLVITDIDMPGMDGNEVAKHIRASDESETPIVAITGSADDLIRKELFDLILRKPFELEDLVDAIRSVT